LTTAYQLIKLLAVKKLFSKNEIKTGTLLLSLIIGLVLFGATIPSTTAAPAETPSQTPLNSDVRNLPTDQALLDAFDESLRYDLLYPYYPTAEDAYGGFVEDRSSTWALQQDDDKFVVTQARYMWTAAKASQFYADDPSQAAIYLNSAAVGFAFLQDMWGCDYDGKTGIALWVDRDGSNGRGGGNLLVYGHAFALYGAAAYYAASGEQSALDFAIQVYNFLDDNVYDPTYGGYYITLDDTRKDTNVNVHVLEALIEFYQALPTSHALRSEVADRLEELLACFHDNAMHYEIGTDCFTYPVMNRDWTSTSNSISFGHDLELAMLMVEAMVALGQDPLTSPYLEKIKDVIDFTFTHEGYRSDGGIYHNGTYNNGTVSITNYTLEWWVQAEGLGAACLMRKLFPYTPFYSDTVNLTWSFIDSRFIDPTNNGWVDYADQWDNNKADAWHANYHNGRALMNGLVWLSALNSILWESYSGGYPPIGTQDDLFVDFNTENTVYMYGTGFNGTYKVIYWDGEGNEAVSEIVSDTSGTLESHHTFTPGQDAAGDWHVTVYTQSANPSTYSAADPNIIADDTSLTGGYAFNVAESAIPEFPTILTAIAALSLSAGIYLWMRRKTDTAPA
jgi:mannobiose 2-epimerase